MCCQSTALESIYNFECALAMTCRAGTVLAALKKGASEHSVKAHPSLSFFFLFLNPAQV